MSSSKIGMCLPGANVGVGVLGDVLVGLLGGLGSAALDGLGDVVCGVLDGLHFVGLVWLIELEN